MKAHLSSLVMCSLLQLLAVVVFLKGFFPIKHAVPGFASFQDTPSFPFPNGNSDNYSTSQEIPPVFGRLVIVLIDALRADFVLPQTSYEHLFEMTYTKSLVNDRNSFSFVAKAHPPTVTMPRIKALTTGGIPGFVDVVLNFDSSALLEDNLISQLHRAGRKMVFYGDDTWMRLFPQHFMRTDGTTSFFVTDYTEVDHNVTRHIPSELSDSGWDVLILHYLGLDHIGHLAGPRSPLMGPKIQEMDQVIKTLHKSITAQDVSRELPSLLLVCGDHGMSDQGSHGGATLQETSTPLIFLSSLFSQQKGSAYEEEEVEQIDLVPTLALLLGVPIPKNSLGVLIPQLLHTIPMQYQLQAAYTNAQQLMAVFKQNVVNYEKDAGFFHLEQAVRSHRRWIEEGGSSPVSGKVVMEQYMVAMRAMRERVAASLSRYDIHAMVLGITLLWMVLLILMGGALSTGRAVVIFPDLSRIFIFLIALLCLSTTQVVMCTSHSGSEFLCSSEPSGLLLSALLVLSLAGGYVFIVPTLGRSAMATWSKVKLQSKIDRTLLVGTFLHTLSLLSSSFVEEEHQTWYFLTLTVTLGLLSKTIIESLASSAPVLPPGDQREHSCSQGYLIDGCLNKVVNDGTHHVSSELSAPSELHSMEKDREDIYHQIQTARSSRLTSTHQETPIEESRKCGLMPPGGCRRRMISAVVVVLFLCRVLRSWNQTGNKWASTPDLGDWLVRPENKSYLSGMVAGALVIIAASLQSRSLWFERSLISLALFGTYCFRAATGAIYLPGFYKESVSKGTAEAQAVYAIILILAIYSHWKHWTSPPAARKLRASTSVYTVWVLLATLVMRPHNIIMLAMVTVQEYCVSRYFIGHFSSTTTLTLFHLWIGQAAFFYQGNSNSLSSLDVSAGYAGLESYSPVVVTTLITVATYAGPVLWILSLGKSLAFYEIQQPDAKHSNRYQRNVIQACYTVLLSRALVLAFYTILVTLQRYHLFVWSVFSPKLLYEGMHTLVITTVILGLLSLVSRQSNT